jgi:hypothetical protein
MKNQIVEVFDLNLEETEMIVPLSKAEAKEHLPVSLRSPFNILAEYRKRDGIGIYFKQFKFFSNN